MSKNFFANQGGDFMASQQDVIKAFMKTLDATSSRGSDAIDEAVQACSNFKNAEELIARIVADCKSYNGNGVAFLKEKCGIILDNSDTGAITGKDAGGSTVKTEETIVPESVPLKNYTKNSFTVNGLTFTLEDNTILSDKTKSKEKFIWQGLYTWWAPGALDLIKSSYGYSFTDKDVNFKKVTVKFVDDSSTTWLAWNDWSDRDSDGKSDGKIDKVTLVINMRYYKNIDVTNPNGKSSSTDFYLDKTLAHELTHTLMHAKINYSYKLPGFIKEGMSELTIGIDNERTNDISYLAKNPDVLSKNLNLNSTSGSGYAYEAGYIFLRYLAKQGTISPMTRTKNIINDTSKTRVTGTAYADTITNTGANVTITALGGNDSINNSGAKASISGGAGNDTVRNTDRGTDVTIYGGAGNDSVLNSANAKIYGGDDADTINNTNLGVNAIIYGDSGNDSVLNSAKAKIYGGDDADTIANTNLGANATLSGDGGNDYIRTTDANNVSIDGGAGNDKIELLGSAKGLTVKGGAGNDTVSIAAGSSALIQYASGDGNDSISGFGATDTLSISGGTHSTTQSGSNVIVTVDKGKVTLVGAAKLSKLNIVGIGPTPLKINNNTAKKKLTGTSLNDTIYNGTGGTNVTISGGKGNDDLDSRGANVSISGGDGNDSIYNEGAKTTVNGDGGKDSIRNFSANSKIYGGAENDTIYNGTGGNYVTISGDTGNDDVNSRGNNVSIGGGAGNDSIYVDGAKVTVNAGTGDDSVRNFADNVLFQYANGDGNDSISGFGANSTLSISGGSYTSVKSGSNVIFTVGKGKITLVDAAKLSKLNVKGTLSGGGSSSSTLMTVTNSTKSPVTIDSAIKTVDAKKRTTEVRIIGNALDNSIYGGSKNDTIWGESGNDTIYGGNGEDSIFGGKDNDYLYGGKDNDSLCGNEGNDYLYGETGNDSLWGGAGDDKIYGGTGNDYLVGGNGNDSLWGGNGSDTFVYYANTGTDKIFDFTGTDMLQILNANGSKGSFTNSSFSSNTLTLNISGGGTVICSGVNSSSTFNINGTTYKVSGSSITKK